MTKSILIISRSTYPGKDPRSMRTDELAKEMARQGHNVILYVLTGSYDYTDYEKHTNITIKSLGKTYLSSYDHATYKTLNIYAKIFNKLCGKYIEFPDIELMRNTYVALSQELKGKVSFDLIITIGAPHPIHWGASLYKTWNPEKFKHITWVADCGDPYVGNPFKKPPFYFTYVEKWFGNNVDFITVPLKEAIKAYPTELAHKIKVIPQGFNLNEIRTEQTNYLPNNPVPTFIYAGTLYRGHRDPSPLLDYLSTLHIDFKFIMYTGSSKLINKYSRIMGNKLVVLPYIPRIELIKTMQKADFLINLENPSSVQSPSKLIDYAISGRPVLSINTNDKLNTNKIDQFLSGNYSDSLSFENISDYDIKNVSKKFLNLIS